MKFRIGYGYDVHRLAENESLWLGGIKITHTKGAVAHSDGDVLIHAICDAILGAASLRDIGYHFPDNSDEFRNIDSKQLLAQVTGLIDKKGFSIGNIDSTVCLQKPKIKDFIPQMIAILCKVMHIADDCLSIKATTTEKLGFVGNEQGITAHAVVLLYKTDD